ncbi:MAG: dTDP-4-dehydrorhamnose reductase, partial [Gemmiger sp.]
LKLWITGAKGHVGAALCQLLDPARYELVLTDREVDIADRETVRRYAQAHRPDVIINCAGLSDAAACEADPDLAFRVNALGARNLATQAQQIGAKLIHMSTDDVFAKLSDRPYNEFDAPCPSTVYGRSKLAGEQFVASLCTRYVIVRSSWVYGIGSDFVSTVLAAANDPDCPWLMVPTDISGCPTSAADLAMVVAEFIENECLGVYHAVCRGWCSRFDYAQEILRCAHAEEKLALHPTHSQEHGASYSVLDNMMLRLEGLRQPREWREALRDYIARTGGEE